MTTQIHCEIGSNAMAAGDTLTAQNAYYNALSFDRNCLQALNNLGILFMQSGRIEAALRVGERATKVGAKSFEAWTNYGYSLAVAGRFPEALKALRRADRLRPDTPAVLHYIGMTYYSLGEWDRAIATYDKELACALTPAQKVEAIDQRGLALLGAARYVDGLMDNKMRWSVLVAHPLMHSNIPQWTGQMLTGKSIAILHEQGDGDTFQFVRFVPMLKERYGAEHTVLSVRPEMINLLQNSKLADEVVSFQEVPVVDYICPMLTYPAYLGLGNDLDPNVHNAPYLVAPAARGGLEGAKPKVGLVWAGKPGYAADHWRSMDPQNLFELVSNPDVDFYSLQVGERAQDLWKTGLKAFVSDLSPLCKDWERTASLINQLDLVVSVDTAPAHLAAAIGKPVALMIPAAGCWRWHHHDTQTTPWYPSMQIYRQKTQGDWKPVIDAVAKRIDMLVIESGGP